MNSVLDGAFQNFIVSDDLAREHNMVRDAETHTCEQHPKGYFKFIRLKLLNHRLGTDQIHRFKFVWIVDVYYHTRGMTGTSIPEFIEKQGCLTFRYDPMLRAHVAYMFDDYKEAMYAKTGQNRDFLASHYETGDFEITDETVLKDVMERVVVLKAKSIPVTPIKDTGLTSEQIEALDNESLDGELARIKEMEKRILEQKAKKIAVQNVSRETLITKAQSKPEEIKQPKPVRNGRKARIPLVTA